MSDIVDRVRRIWSIGPDDFFSELLQHLEDQEAEIERLRAELARYKEAEPVAWGVRFNGGWADGVGGGPFYKENEAKGYAAILNRRGYPETARGSAYLVPLYALNPETDG